jgi:hypothetical protein
LIFKKKKKLLPLCYCAISLLVWFTPVEFLTLFESSADSMICSLRIMRTEYLVGLNLLDKTWTFRNSMFLSCRWNTLSQKWWQGKI